MPLQSCNPSDSEAPPCQLWAHWEATVHVSPTCAQFRSQGPRPRRQVVALQGLEAGGLHLPSSLLRFQTVKDVMCQVKVLHSDF